MFDVTINAYRRLMWLERDLGASRRDIEALRTQHADEASALLGDLFAIFAAPGFPLER